MNPAHQDARSRPFIVGENIVATPIRNGWRMHEMAFDNGVSIRRLEGVLWERAVVAGYISAHEMQSLQQAEYWLCISEVEDETEAYFRSWLAVICTQVLCPVGAQNIHLRFAVTPEGLDNVGSNHHDELHPPLMGRVTDLVDVGLPADFDILFTNALRAYREGVIRIQNPLTLLQHGLHSRESLLSLLFWVMGLDMMMMAGNEPPFAERLIQFVGAGTFIFPQSSTTGERPRYVVEDVAADLFRLRNEIAHGRETPRPFLEPFEFVTTGGEVINVEPMNYAEHLSQCAVFLLCSCLRKVFVQNLVTAARLSASWRPHVRA